MLISACGKRRIAVHIYCHAGEAGSRAHFGLRETPHCRAHLLPCRRGGVPCSFRETPHCRAHLLSCRRGGVPCSFRPAGNAALPCTFTAMQERRGPVLISACMKRRIAVHIYCPAGEAGSRVHFGLRETPHCRAHLLPCRRGGVPCSFRPA